MAGLGCKWLVVFLRSSFSDSSSFPDWAWGELDNAVFGKPGPLDPSFCCCKVAELVLVLELLGSLDTDSVSIVWSK